MSFLRNSPSFFVSLRKKITIFKFLTFEKTHFIPSEDLELKVSNPIIHEEILKTEVKRQHDLKVKEMLQNIQEAVKYRENMKSYEIYFSKNFDLIENENYQSQIIVTLSLGLDKSKQNKEFLIQNLASLNQNVQKFNVKSLVDAIYAFSQFSILIGKIEINIFSHIIDRILNEKDELENLDLSLMLMFLKNIQNNISNKDYYDLILTNFKKLLVVHLKNMKIKNFDSLITYVYKETLDHELSEITEQILEKLMLINESMTKNEIQSTLISLHKIQKRLVSLNSFELLKPKFHQVYSKLYRAFLDNDQILENLVLVTKILETEKIVFPKDLMEIGRGKMVTLLKESQLVEENKYFDSVSNICDLLRCFRFLDSRVKILDQYVFLFSKLKNIILKKEDISNEDFALIFEQIANFMNRGIAEVKELLVRLTTLYLNNIDNMDKNFIVTILKCCRNLEIQLANKLLEALISKPNRFSLEQISIAVSLYMKIFFEFFNKHEAFISYFIETVNFSNPKDLGALRKFLNILNFRYDSRNENKYLQGIKQKIIDLLDNSVKSGEYKKNIKVFFGLINCFLYFSLVPSSLVVSTERTFIDNFNIYIRDNLVEMLQLLKIFSKEYEKRVTNYLKPRLINLPYIEFKEVIFTLSRTRYVKNNSYVQETLFEKLKKNEITEFNFLDSLHSFTVNSAGTVEFWKEVEFYFLTKDKSLNALRDHYTSLSKSLILNEEQTYEKAKIIYEGRSKLLLYLKTFNINNKAPVKFCFEFLPVVKKLLEESQFSIESSLDLVESFSKTKVNDDELWYRIQELCVRTQKELSLKQIIRLLMSFGRVRKGSGYFWQKYLKILQNNISRLSIRELFSIFELTKGYVNFDSESWKEEIKKRSANDPTGKIKHEVEMYRPSFFKNL